ncbi:MAG: plasmid pRiA4b ORF-3 family protein [Rubripirellula sp.]
MALCSRDVVDRGLGLVSVFGWLPKFLYDFGDDGRHEILCEGYPSIEKAKEYPLCVEGGRACPPEDIGGPWGYAEYLEALADPSNERHDELIGWIGFSMLKRFRLSSRPGRCERGCRSIDPHSISIAASRS